MAYKFLEKHEAKKYYSTHYPKILLYWQKYNPEPRPTILKLLKIKNKRILDIGCGNGSILKNLIKQNEVHGIDISTKLLKQAKKLGIKTTCCDIDKRVNFPYPKYYFDVILMFELLEHSFFPELLLKKCFEVLKPKGLLYITTPNKLYLKITKTIQKSIKTALEHVYKGNTPMGAKRFPDINILPLLRIKKILGTLGFSIEKSYGWCWEWEKLSPKERQRLWLNPLKAPHLLIKIKKSLAIS